MTEFLAYTRVPTGRRRDGWRRLLNGSPIDRGEVSLGIHQFYSRDNFTRKYVEAFHDAAFEAGYESELCYFDDGWEVRVRAPGAKQPAFATERLAAPFGRIPRA